MKVVRKEACKPAIKEMPIGDIKTDTVFSGKPNHHTHRIFYKCEDGCVRIAYTSGGSCDGVLFEKGVVRDYKELNAYLCIEE